MPELPEVETIVRGLNKKVLGRTFIDVWTDFKKIIKRPQNFEQFREEIKGKKIEKIWRRGKNILFNLSDDKILLMHQKLTGHLLYGKWQKIDDQWKPIQKGPLEDPMNRFLHLIFWFDNGKMLALSDLRKFAKAELWDSDKLKESKEFNNLGAEPLEKKFTFGKFKECLRTKQEKISRQRNSAKPFSNELKGNLSRGKVKQVLMDQTVIAGIGNIYSDEILWEAKVNPFKDVSKLSELELKKIYQAIKKILKKAVKLQGESISDFRDIEGKKGNYDKARKVYRREGEECPRCKAAIKRIKLAGRSAHFCPVCQPL